MKITPEVLSVSVGLMAGVPGMYVLTLKCEPGTFDHVPGDLPQVLHLIIGELTVKALATICQEITK